ncbi:N-acetylmuramoyl-L-alanine amidase family protein [Desertivirga arenae]|uniref:N-acetylmuramoyl-L-alanine amidase family protein n=1 Tax=Desertivirga arenae TaxID=2810309 RepID=UPI001A971CD6|nr:N-acetylmuramoyl-L-alanine amidase [Pedobacter sp. SYSU D00823]
MKLKPLKRFIIAFAAVMLLLPFSSFSNNSNIPPYRIKTIVIDAGHGGEDGATRGAIAKEKELALQVALRLGKAIEDSMPDVKVVYTRTSDVFVPLYERVGLANQVKADLFISIHCNDMPKNFKGRSSTKGVETFVSGFHRLDEQNKAIKDIATRENESILLEKDYKNNYDGYDPNDPESMIIFSLMKNAFREQSIKLASFMQNEYVKVGRIDRGVKEKGLAVLARAGMPAVLTEIGFVCNKEEEEYMVSEYGQNEIVNCLLKAIQGYKKQVEL